VEAEDRQRAKEWFNLLASGVLGDDERSVRRRVMIVEELERLLSIEFRSPDHFEEVMEAFFEDRVVSGQDLVNIRKQKGWTQQSLALTLGVSKSFLSKMECGHKPLITKALEFVEEYASADMDNGK